MGKEGFFRLHRQGRSREVDARRQGAICRLCLPFCLPTQMKEQLKILHTKRPGGAIDCTGGMF